MAYRRNVQVFEGESCKLRTMNAFVFRHVPWEDAGRVAEVLTGRGFELHYADLFRDPEPPRDWLSADALVAMGGPMSANDDLPFIRHELAALSEALALGKPVLGICLGSQTLARAAGARVYPNRVKEIGWAPVEWTAAAAIDPLFHGLPPAANLFHWHGETFDLPRGAERLARSRDCANQAFRLGDASYGLQFHLEVTPGMISDWCGQDSNSADVQELRASPDPEQDAARLTELALLVFGRWADLIIGRSARLAGRSAKL